MHLNLLFVIFTHQIGRFLGTGHETKHILLKIIT